MAATLKDIAKATGLSVPSVCLILNGRGEKFRESSRRAVFEAARKLKYRPDMVMRRMGRASDRRDAIGLIIGPPRNDAEQFAQARMQRGMQNVLAGRDQLLVVAQADHLGDMQDPSRRPPRLIRERFVDGLIICGPHFDGAAQRIIDHYEIEAVWLATQRCEPMDCVVFDDEAGGRTAAEHLMAQRRRGLMYVGDGSTPSSAGYRAAMAAAGVGACEVDGVPEALRYMQDRRDAVTPITGIVAGSTDIAHQIIDGAMHMNLHCPSDFGLVAVDAQAALGVTTACGDHLAMGEAAATMLLDKLAGGKPVNSLAMPGQLVEGGTAGGPTPQRAAC